MKKTKIICTLGPASCNEKTLTQMVDAGMNGARVNMSHGTLEGHKQTIDLVKKVREKLGVPLAIIADTKGPEIRISTFEKGSIMLNDGDEFIFTSRDVAGNQREVSLQYKKLVKTVKKGDKIFGNNGMLAFKVKEVTDTDIICKVLTGGKLSDRKGLNIPHVKPDGDYLSEQDKIDIAFACRENADFIAASFVTCKEDIVELKQFMKENGGENIHIIAKIENAEGVRKMEEIAKLCDGLMVARGDLGVEIPLEQLPESQKKMIKTCLKHGKLVVVATEMLESMTASIRPTRAEVSDVAGAVHDLTGSTMLSGETAVGKYPALVVKTMSKIALEEEKNISYTKRYFQRNAVILDDEDAVCDSACKMALSRSAKVIVVYTNTGRSAELISRHRVNIPILALTPNEKVMHQLGMCWNVTPLFHPTVQSGEEKVQVALKMIADLGLAKKGNKAILIAGQTSETGKTNLVRLLEV